MLNESLAKRLLSAVADPIGNHQVTTCLRPTDEMLEDAYHRLTDPRSITAWVNGDPAPGHSALDKKRWTA